MCQKLEKVHPNLKKCVQNLKKCAQNLKKCAQNLKKCVENFAFFPQRCNNHTQIRPGIKSILTNYKSKKVHIKVLITQRFFSYWFLILHGSSYGGRGNFNYQVCTKVYQSVLVCTKVYQSALGCTKVYQNVLGCTRAYYGAPKYTRAH